MNLHFITDNGFLNYFIEVNERVNPAGTNKYIICHSESLFKKPERVKIKNEKVLVAAYNSKEFYQLLGDLNNYERIFFHFLTDQMCHFINTHSNLSSKFSWVFWGADLYSPLSFFAKEIYDNTSQEYFIKNGTFTYTKNPVMNFLKYGKRLLFKSQANNTAILAKQKAISRIDYFLHYNEKDLEVARKFFSAKAAFQPFFYFEYDYSKLSPTPPSDLSAVRQKFRLRENATTLLLGHSASLSNNHITVLNNLKKTGDANFNILCPLSYGDKKYADYVIRTGKQLFGDRFIPLLEFLNKEDYLNLLYCVDIAIMNHLRTEAAGNVFMMLAMGKKVFCNQKSNLYAFLAGNSIYLSPTQSIGDTSKQPLINDLNKQQKGFNHNKICELFSIQQAEKYISEISRL